MFKSIQGFQLISSNFKRCIKYSYNLHNSYDSYIIYHTYVTHITYITHRKRYFLNIWNIFYNFFSINRNDKQLLLKIQRKTSK